ncbi:MAG: M23 family metallopeptidase [Bacteroidetes bacterium]|nr:M23 family metallopeptidase [Bacteroidota bacterium]
MRSVITVFLVLISLNLFLPAVIRADDKNPKKKKKSQNAEIKKIKPSLLSITQKLNDLSADENFYGRPEKIAARWNVIITDIRKSNLSRKDAVDSLYVFTNQLWDFMNARIAAKAIKKYSDAEWVFPLKGYGPAAIGGRNGNGYIVGGFDFFDGNTGGHPAQDIFINDRDQDGLDDNTGKPVEVLSMSGGIVIETRKNWTTDMMDIKGGNIVYIYDNYTNGLFYYAHLKDVLVNVGDYVEPGKVIGTVGRTGKNAYPSRSPTHLHIMYVRSFDGDLVPENLYKDLINVKTLN